MRWKLLLISSLLAALVGAGASLWIARSLGTNATASLDAINGNGFRGIAALLVPIAATTFASIFVYRHTARRRSLQAMATALFAAVLTLAALLIGSLVFSQTAPRGPLPAPTQTPQNVG